MIFNKSLTIKNITKSDESIYKCVMDHDKPWMSLRIEGMILLYLCTIKSKLGIL